MYMYVVHLNPYGVELSTVNPRTSAKPRLRRDLVVDTAIAMADSEGLEAVTIRRLAQELGVTPMALYWHFADKDALLVAVSERLWEDIATELDIMPATGDDGWADLQLITESVMAVLRRHPGCAALTPLAVLGCRSGLGITERALERFAEFGLPPDRAADLAHFLLSTCITLVSTEPGGHVIGPEEEKEMRARKVALANLPAERYPQLVKAATFFLDCPDPEVYYRRGVEYMIGGIRHQVATQASQVGRARKVGQGHSTRARC
jgi:TetR/AcrR family tetracycline transcriptional repressor